jgi:hypothetical protein
MANDRNFIPRRSNCEKQTDHADEQNDVSKDDASKEVTTPADAPVARLEAGHHFLNSLTMKVRVKTEKASHAYTVTGSQVYLQQCINFTCLRKKQTDHADEQNDVSKDDAYKEVTTPADVAVARPETGHHFLNSLTMKVRVKTEKASYAYTVTGPQVYLQQSINFK